MTKPKMKRYDVTEFFEGEDDMLAYLDAAFEDGHPAVIAHALGNVARARGMTQVAHDCGLGRESLYKSLSKNGNPELSTVLKVLGALRIRLRVEPEA